MSPGRPWAQLDVLARDETSEEHDAESCSSHHHRREHGLGTRQGLLWPRAPGEGPRAREGEDHGGEQTRRSPALTPRGDRRSVRFSCVMRRS